MGERMKFVVIGLGSMGKRRVRNLLALGYEEIYGYDIREDRKREAKEQYGIKILEKLDFSLFDIMIISTPPDLHYMFAKLACEHKKHAFMEANVVNSEDFVLLYKMIPSNLVIVPSATMLFFPFVKKVREVLPKIGDILNINYQVGQYLPDWHPWEDIKDFYVSKRATGACREIVPFELSWLDRYFGPFDVVCGVKDKLSDLDTNIDDLYHAVLKMDKGYLHLTIEVLSRPKASRYLNIVGTEGRIYYSGDEQKLWYENLEEKREFCFDQGTIQKSYINPEEPYIEEMHTFIEAVLKKDARIFPNSLVDDYRVLNYLYTIEQKAGNSSDLPR